MNEIFQSKEDVVYVPIDKDLQFIEEKRGDMMEFEEIIALLEKTMILADRLVEQKTELVFYENYTQNELEFFVKTTLKTSEEYVVKNYT